MNNKRIPSPFASACYFVILLTFSLLSSCQKDKQEPAHAGKLSVGELLRREKTWKLTSLTSAQAKDFSGKLSTNWYAFLPACTMDNLYDFGGFPGSDVATVSVDQGSSKCNLSDAQTETTAMYWKLNPENTIMTMENLTGETLHPFGYELMEDSGISEDWKILELTKNYFKVSYQTQVEGIYYTLTAEFKLI